LFLVIILFVFGVCFHFFRTWFWLAVDSTDVLVHLVHVDAVKRSCKNESQEVEGGNFARYSLEETHYYLAKCFGLKLNLADRVFFEVIWGDAVACELQEDAQEKIVLRVGHSVILVDVVEEELCQVHKHSSVGEVKAFLLVLRILKDQA